MDPTTKIKNCPFCGAPADLDAVRTFRSLTSGNLERAIAVYCTSCTAEISVCVHDVPEITPEDVVSMWNDQPVMDNMQLLLQRLAYRLDRLDKSVNATQEVNDYLSGVGRWPRTLRYQDD